MTVNDVFIQAMALADEMTDTINVVNESDTASYKARTPGILNLLQAELIRQGDLYSNFEYSWKPIDNLLGHEVGFTPVSYVGEEQTFEGPGTPYAYSIDVDGEGTIYIEDFTGVWNTLATITTTDPTYRSFTNYKGVVTPTPNSSRGRIRLAGTYQYNMTNFALFGSPMKLARVPAYAPWMKVTLPADFKSMDQVVNELGNASYQKDGFYKWENMKDLYVNYLYEGTVRINYRPIPTLLTTTTDLIQLDDVTARTLLPYGLAAELFKEENKDIASYCASRYSDLKASSMIRRPASEQQMQDVYGGFDYGNSIN
jgi:hypothetical protein